VAKLILCATPIGNLEDVSLRALRVLGEADVVACEDTRRTRKLLTHHGVSARALTVYNEGNERRKAAELVRSLERGQTVVLVSDAGVPGLSDPGFRLVRAAIDAGIDVEIVPGPNAAVSALAVSGLPPGRFVFEGFFSKKQGERRRRIEELSAETRTLVFFESPHRVEETIADLLAGLGDRPAALARELTKIYEEVRRGPLSELLRAIQTEGIRGEIVLVVAGAIHDHRQEVAPEELARMAHKLMDSGIERSEALGRVARDTGVRKREVFDALLEEKS
jgi:16S rRNA (cytidine1402-2'-O)-methyltransferase